MEVLMAFLVGGLVAVGVYLMLRPHLIQFLIGFLVLGNAANLLIFTAGRLGSQFPPLVQRLTWISPLTSVVHIARALFTGKFSADLWLALALVIGFTVVFCAISLVTMRRRIVK